MVIKSTPSSTRLSLLFAFDASVGGSHVHWGFLVETRSGAQGLEKWKNGGRFSLSLVL